MRSTELVLLLGLLGAPLLAQEPAAPESPGEARLRVENEALRRELEATRDRLEALEALVRERLGPAGEAWTAPGQRPPETPPGPLLQPARLSSDESTLLVPDLRLPEDAGAAGPAELVDALIEGCRALPLDLPEGPLTGLASRLGAFEPTPQGAFLVPPRAWAPLATGSAAAYPQRRQLEGELRQLAPCLSGARLTSVTIQPGAPPAAPRLEARLDCPNGPIRLHLTTARVNGRLLLVRVRVPWFEANARAALGGVARLLSSRTRQGEPLELPSPAELELVGARVLDRPDPFTLRLPGYQVRFQRLAQGEWGAEAEPLLDGAPRLAIGPLPGHDPRRAPYQVRQAPCGPR